MFQTFALFLGHDNAASYRMTVSSFLCPTNEVFSDLESSSAFQLVIPAWYEHSNSGIFYITWAEDKPVALKNYTSKEKRIEHEWQMPYTVYFMLPFTCPVDFFISEPKSQMKNLFCFS